MPSVLLFTFPYCPHTMCRLLCLPSAIDYRTVYLNILPNRHNPRIQIVLANVSPTQNLSDAPAASWLVRGLQNRQQLNLPFGLGVWLCLAAFALPTCQTALSQDLKKSAESPAATEVPAQKKPTDKAEDSKSAQKKNSSAEKRKWKS